MIGSAWDVIEPPAPRPLDEAWIDRLTALRVLATHGDPDAEVEVRRWIAVDPGARQVWDAIDEVHDQLPTEDVR